MKILNKISEFFKKLFHKEEIKMIEKPKETQVDEFLNSIKVDITKENKTKVETMVCPGDGLGIQRKIEY